MATPDVKAQPGERRHAGHRVAYVTIGVLLAFIVITLPIAAVSVIVDVIGESNARYVFGTPTITNQQTHSIVEVDIIAFNEWEGTVTLRVSGHHACKPECNWSDRFVFASVLRNGKDATETVPSSDTVTFPPSVRELTQRITLPIFGDPIRYPFDQYVLGLGIIMTRVYSDGTEQVLNPQEADSQLQFSVRARIPRETMTKPVALDPTIVRNPDDLTPYVYLYQMNFNRPTYLQILAVLLVLLVIAASAYAVFMRPLDQLVINAGALVLGVWGIRAILLGTGVPGITAVDLALSLAILFLLVAITLRALHSLQEPTGWWFRHLLFWRGRTPGTAEPSAGAESDETVDGRAALDYFGPGTRAAASSPPAEPPQTEPIAAGRERRAP